MDCGEVQPTLRRSVVFAWPCRGGRSIRNSARPTYLPDIVCSWVTGVPSDELLHTLAAGIRAQTAQPLGVRSLTSTRGKDLKIKLAQYDRGTAAHICCSPRHAINCFLLRLERRMLRWQARLYGRDRLMKPRQYISAVESA